MSRSSSSFLHDLEGLTRPSLIQLSCRLAARGIQRAESLAQQKMCQEEQTGGSPGPPSAAGESLLITSGRTLSGHPRSRGLPFWSVAAGEAAGLA